MLLRVLFGVQRAKAGVVLDDLLLLGWLTGERVRLTCAAGTYNLALSGLS